MAKVVATGNYLPMSETRGAAVEINGRLEIYNGQRTCGFLQKLKSWVCNTYDIPVKNPAIEIIPQVNNEQKTINVIDHGVQVQ